MIFIADVEMQTPSHEADDIETSRKPVTEHSHVSVRYWNYSSKVFENFSYDPKSTKKIKNKLSQAVIEIESFESSFYVKQRIRISS